MKGKMSGNYLQQTILKDLSSAIASHLLNSGLEVNKTDVSALSIQVIITISKMFRSNRDNSVSLPSVVVVHLSFLWFNMQNVNCGCMCFCISDKKNESIVLFFWQKSVGRFSRTYLNK